MSIEGKFLTKLMKRGVASYMPIRHILQMLQLSVQKVGLSFKKVGEHLPLPLPSTLAQEMIFLLLVSLPF